jgi:hypothetical protein
MQRTAPSTSPDCRPSRERTSLRAVQDLPQRAERASATLFSETVRVVVAISRRRGLRPPVFRSPPRLEGFDRTIRRRAAGTVVVAVRRDGRPVAAVQADVIEGVIAANGLTGESADRFRHAAWAALDGAGTGGARRATMEPEPPARVA